MPDGGTDAPLGRCPLHTHHVGWNETWVQGHDGRGPGWWSVILWLALLTVGTIGLAANEWETSRTSAVVVMAIGAAVFAWILAGRGRKGPEAGEDDQ